MIVDLEKASVDEVAAHLRGADAVVFAAGAGPGSGAARKETVDRDAAILLADAAEAAGVERYVMVSAMAADPQATADDEVFQAYLRAKGVADEAIRARTALNWTIVRPGMLTNDAGTGRVTIAESTGRGSIPREDVAAVLVAVLDEPRHRRREFRPHLRRDADHRSRRRARALTAILQACPSSRPCCTRRNRPSRPSR